MCGQWQRCYNFTIIFCISDFVGMTVGFSKKSYVTTERDEHISICVNVLNTADEGALQPFTVGLLPEPGVLISDVFRSFEAETCICTAITYLIVGHN